LVGVTAAAAAVAFAAERALVAALGGGCQLPLGAIARIEGDALDLLAVVLSPDGGPPIRVRERGAVATPAGLGQRVAEALLAQGAGEILAAMREER
jgi:hydroxymethylbilane synthase